MSMFSNSTGYPLFIVFLLLCCFNGPDLFGTHLRGGHISYSCLGNDQYEINLTVYRDCFFGDPLAFFDDPAAIGVFNADNDLVLYVNVPFAGDDTLQISSSGPCLVYPMGQCVHKAVYSTVLTLPEIPGGYNIVYQRCCRSPQTNNIVDPNNAGFTFQVEINSQGLESCNSAPLFVDPPYYLCANQSTTFNLAQNDAEGDSLVYRLCEPLHGASKSDPQPVPPAEPPYNKVGWQTNFSSQQPLGNGADVILDSQTGMVEIQPTANGLFVIAFCVEEYRDGKLLSTIRREFHYEIGECAETRASFNAPSLQCDDLEVEFTNRSITNTFQNNQWFFGGIQNPLGTQISRDATFQFPDTGTYEICLITAPGSVCADTVCGPIKLQTTHIQPQFEYEMLSCGDSTLVEIRDYSYDSVFTIIDYDWDIEPGSSQGDTDAMFFITPDDIPEVILSWRSSNGCQLSERFTPDADRLITEVLADTVSVCRGDDLYLNPDLTGVNWNFFWSSSIPLDDPNAVNPLASPATSANVVYQVNADTANCTATGSMYIDVFDSFGLQAKSTACQGDFFFVDLELDKINRGGTSFEVLVNGSFYDTYNYDDIPTGKSIRLGPFVGDGATDYMIDVEDSDNMVCSDQINIGKIYCGDPIVDPDPPENVNILQPVVSRTFKVLHSQPDKVNHIRVLDASFREINCTWKGISAEQMQVTMSSFHAGWHVLEITTGQESAYYPFIVVR